jgi:hypothetical protein
MVDQLVHRYTNSQVRIALGGHSGGGSFIFGYLNAVEDIPDQVERISFLDANYAYDPELGHPEKLGRWLKSSPGHFLSVLAYNDAVALLSGKPFVSATGGTWYRTQLMRTNFASSFSLDVSRREQLEVCTGLGGRLQLLLLENPERRIWHTVMVERNGFIHGMLSGTSHEEKSYRYLTEPAYFPFIEQAP